MANDMTTTSTKILVLGAGFGGLTFCHTFRHANASVTYKRGARIIIGDAAGRTPDGAWVIPNHHSEAPREPQLETPVRDLRQPA
jgi:cation diffusion facilitator CzcD-associated flavoprotein CzcO